MAKRKEAKYTFWLLTNLTKWARQAMQSLPYDPAIAGTFKYICRYRSEIENFSQYLEKFKPQIREHGEYNSINMSKVVTKAIILKHESWFAEYTSESNIKRVTRVADVSSYMPKF